jgi:hypothetical protein
MVHLKNNWQISLSYGQWYFNNSAKSNDETILDFPNNMGLGACRLLDTFQNLYR